MRTNEPPSAEPVEEAAAERGASRVLSDPPTVSVVIPMRNEERFIGRCLKSVLAQDYDMSKVEVVVVDGRSTDRSREIIREFASKHPNVKVVDNPKRTTPAAMNLGIQSSTGELISLLNAHGEHAVDHLRHCTETAVRTGADLITGMLKPKPGADTLMARTVHALLGHRLGMGGPTYRVGGEEGPVDTISFGCYRRDTLERIGLFDERLVRSQDNEMTNRILSSGGKVWFNPKIVNYWYARATLRGWLQMLGKNGSWHPYLMRIIPSAFRIRYLAPLVFLLALVVGGLGGFFWWPLWLVGGAALASHMIVSLLAAVQLARRHGWDLMLTLPWFFPLSHLWYGAATLYGIFRFGFVPLGTRPEPTKPVPQPAASGTGSDTSA